MTGKRKLRVLKSDMLEEMKGEKKSEVRRSET